MSQIAPQPAQTDTTRRLQQLVPATNGPRPRADVQPNVRPSRQAAIPAPEVSPRARASVSAPPAQRPSIATPSTVAAVASRSTVEIQTDGSVGAGTVIEPGLIATSSHVAEPGKQLYWGITVDGRLRTGTATVVGRSKELDIALLRINDTSIPAVTMAGRQPALGDWVMTAGSPLGLTGSVGAGIVSGLRRNSDQLVCDCIQTDAPLNLGNSGGGLYDASGRYTGLLALNWDGSQSVGFAIPAPDVAEAIARLKHGDIVAQRTGVTFVAPSILELARAGAAPFTGVLVGRVEPNSPASRAGLRQGDRVETIDGKPVTGLGMARVRTVLAGKTLTLGVRRSGALTPVALRL